MANKIVCSMLFIALSLGCLAAYVECFYPGLSLLRNITQNMPIIIIWLVGFAVILILYKKNPFKLQ